jgi:hypothetical protein
MYICNCTQTHTLTHTRTHTHTDTHTCTHPTHACQPAERNSGQVTAAHIDAALTQLKGGAQAADLITVVNAFAVPKISYDPVGRKMIADHKPRHLLADAQVCRRASSVSQQ